MAQRNDLVGTIFRAVIGDAITMHILNGRKINFYINNLGFFYNIKHVKISIYVLVRKSWI
jgi:hypothetical protein